MTRKMFRTMLAKNGVFKPDFLSFWALVIGVAITVATGISLSHSINDETEQTMTLALNTARANLSKDLLLSFLYFVRLL